MAYSHTSFPDSPQKKEDIRQMRGGWMFTGKFFRAMGAVMRGGWKVLFTARGLGWKQTFVLLFLISVIFSGIQMSREENNPTLFWINFQNELADIDQGIINDIDNLKEKKADKGGMLAWYDLIFPALSIAGGLYFIYYLWRIFNWALDFILDRSRPHYSTNFLFIVGLILLKVMTLLILKNALMVPLNFTITGPFWEDLSYLNDAASLIPPPVLGLWHLFANLDVWSLS